tara:strand:+ start:6714 stop:7373 length:660 start_codon:yes stop_codon:yes gene_type:complete
MNNVLPEEYVPNFTNERLTIIAEALLTQCYETDNDLQSENDSGYSVGCTRFDRQKNKLKNMSLEYSWLNISDGSNRLVMNVDGAPFRFTRDDYLSPKKLSSVKISDTEAIQIESYFVGSQGAFDWDDDTNCEAETPIKWRFFIDVSESAEVENERDYEIYFVGMNLSDQPKCIWKLSEHISGYVAPVDSDKPLPVKSAAAKTSLPADIIEKLDSDKENE